MASSGPSADAAKAYQRVLAIDPSNERALAGLRSLDMDNRHEQLIKDGMLAFDKKEIGLARQKVSTVLMENPDNDAALALQRKIADATASVPAESQLSAAYRKQISIEFKDVALKQVFEVLSRTSDLNFLFDKEVKTDQ